MTQTVQKKKAVKAIERHLRNYHTYKAGISNMQKQLDFIMPNVTADYELRENMQGVFVFNSTTENVAIDRIESKRALTLHEDISAYKIIVDSIEEALNVLEANELKFVRIRYFKNCSIEYTAQQLNLTVPSVYTLRNQVTEQLLISLKSLVSLNV